MDKNVHAASFRRFVHGFFCILGGVGWLSAGQYVTRPQLIHSRVVRAPILGFSLFFGLSLIFFRNYTGGIPTAVFPEAV